MSKYNSLWEYISGNGNNEIKLSFDEINETFAKIDKTGYDFGYINF